VTLEERINALDAVPDTPAVLLDAPVMHDNIARMAAATRASGKDLRPHAKTHKMPRIGQLTIDAGAVGLQLAKLGEAEVFADAGIDDIFVGNPIVGDVKIARLLDLAERITVSTSLDSMAVATPLGAAASERGLSLAIRIEIDTGQHRLGVPPNERAVELAEGIDATDGLRLEGVMISDSSQDDRTFHVFAERGQFLYDDRSGDLTLRLENGDMRMLPAPSIDFEEYRISFERFDYTFLALALGHGELRLRMDQLGLAELRDAVARLEAGERPRELRYRSARIYSTQLHRILSVPLASVLLAWVGVPLGMRGFVRSRAWGMIVALALLVGYYSLFVYVQDASRMGHAPAYLLVWIPNATLLVVGAALVWSTRRIQ
jgi:hypothetical protein